MEDKNRTFYFQIEQHNTNWEDTLVFEFLFPDKSAAGKAAKLLAKTHNKLVRMTDNPQLVMGNYYRPDTPTSV